MLSGGPIDPAINVKAFSHLLGECGVILFGAPRLAAKYHAAFPRSLDGAPFLLPPVTQRPGVL
jgi:LysR family transcriptional regulator, transcriptional activator of nhaA